MNERERGFHLLKEYFDKQDMHVITEKGVSVFNTSYGIFGTSGLREVFELFTRIHLERRKQFMDLGSGDGRVVLLAALFTSACGIEGDVTLHTNAEKARHELLDTIPQLSRCSFVCADYTREDLSSYDTLFIYADHNWPNEFQEKLLKECTGTMLSLQNIFSPTLLKKGKTYWISQVPFVSYLLNTEEVLE